MKTVIEDFGFLLPYFYYIVMQCYLKRLGLQVLRSELIMTQIQLGEVDQLLESGILDFRDIIPSENQFLNHNFRERFHVGHRVAFERRNAYRYVRPLRVLEMMGQVSIFAAYNIA